MELGKLYYVASYIADASENKHNHSISEISSSSTNTPHSIFSQNNN